MIGPDGRMNDEAGDLAGLTQEEADERILDWLKERDQLEKRERYRHTVALCERCETRIEPLISLQWWCSMEELEAARARGAARGRVSATTRSRSTASRSTRSRTRRTGTSRARSGGGTSCPLWYCPDGHVTVEETEPDACAECGSTELHARRRRARHVVLVGALAVRDARLARATPRTCARSTPAT